MTSTDDQKRERLAEFLWEKYKEELNTRGRGYSQTKFALEHKISTASLTKYLTKVNLPDENTAFKLALEFGMEIFDILGLDRKNIDDITNRYIISSVVEFGEEERQEVLKIIEDIKKRRGKKNPKPAQIKVAA